MERLGLSVNLLRSLKGAGIQTLDDLRSRSPNDLAKLPGIGLARFSELLAALHPAGPEQVEDGEMLLDRIKGKIAGHRRAIVMLEREMAAEVALRRPDRDGEAVDPVAKRRGT